MPINAIIVDDERLARAELTRLLSQHKEVQIIAEAGNIAEAKQRIDKHKPDVLFLDIEMPGGTGIELAEQLAAEQNAQPYNKTAKIVFCTAYDEFAVDAFALNAVDYLVKPINPKRLSQCLERLGNKTHAPDNVDVLDDNFKLMVKFREQMKIIKLSDIYRFESIGNHAALHTTFGKAYLQTSLNKIEARLNPEQFFRASRAEIIRLDAIESLEPTISYGLIAQLCNEQEVEISRRQAAKLKEQFSIGAF